MSFRHALLCFLYTSSVIFANIVFAGKLIESTDLKSKIEVNWVFPGDALFLDLLGN